MDISSTNLQDIFKTNVELSQQYMLKILFFPLSVSCQELGEES